MSPLDQSAYQVRMEWGPTGAVQCAADIAVVVDVLSFSTSVTVAVERGTAVLPFPWRDDSAEAFAAEHDAVLATGRLDAAREGGHGPSLSPATLLTCDLPPRLVLPSPNGSSIAAALAGTGAQVVAGCLRNASAVARWIAPQVGAGASVAVVAAGERWAADDSLRPALEDHLGAGAILAAIGHAARCSPEVEAAGVLFALCADRVGPMMAGSASGRELSARGFADDVVAAGELNASPVVPLLVDGAFVPATPNPSPR